jgi:membrane fusion protein (multidrug efflux system)
MFMDYKSNEKSDDAQVEQYISPVNLRASGYIKKIYFKEHQNVKKGDTLLVLDDREYRIRVMEAEAALKDAMAGANVIDASVQTTQTSATV